MSNDSNSRQSEPEQNDQTSPEEDAPKEGKEKKSLGDAVKELVEPFLALGQTSRALFGVYLPYLIEGLVYFGILTILGKYLSENVGLKDLHAGWVYSLFTGGITLSMLFLGGVSDRIGVRRALLISLGLLAVGRLLVAASGTFFTQGGGAGSAMFVTVALGLLVVVFGYGMYQPASYAAVKQFTTEKQATMAYAMIYGLMNLGAFFSGLLSPPIRQRFGIESVYWTYFGLIVMGLLAVMVIMTQRVVERDTVTNIDEKKPENGAEAEEKPAAPKAKLFTPGFSVIVVVIAAAVVALIYLGITRHPGPAADTLDSVKAQYKAAARALRLPDKELTDEGLSKAKLATQLSKHTQTLRTLAASIHPPEKLSAGTRVDKATFQVLRTQVLAEARLLQRVSAGAFPLTDPVVVGNKLARAAHDRLRSLGVFYMAVAYRLVGTFDRRTLRRIQQRQSLPSEDRIPLDRATQKRIIATTTLESRAMFEALARATDDEADRLRQELGDGAATLGAVLHTEAHLLRLATRTGGQKWSEALSGLMLQRCYLFGTYLIKAAAPMLIKGTKGAPRKLACAFLSARLASDQQYVEHMKTAAATAVQIPRGEWLKRWGLRYGILIFVALFFLIFAVVILLKRRPEHPFHDGRFVFFIFILIPVQTLFAHNWLTLPYYIDRAFGGTYVGKNFEFFSNINPLLIFVFTPFVAALTARRKVYNMMISGTFVMAASTFLLVLGPFPALLMVYILLMSIGEAMWQPRFLQWVAEIAPEGQTGAYMGIAQFPWFLTKVVTGMYSGYFLSKYCPLVGPQNTQMMWLIYSITAMVSPVTLMMARRWMIKGMRERAAE